MKNIFKKFTVFLLLLMGGLPLYVEALGKPETIGWRVLQQLNYRTGEMAPELKQLQGKMIRLPGYIVPLDGDEKQITKFLLVPTLGACVHVPPPPPNQIVYVEMPQGISAEMMFYPVWVSGQLAISKSQHQVEGTDYTPEASYEMVGLEVKPYE